MGLGILAIIVLITGAIFLMDQNEVADDISKDDDQPISPDINIGAEIEFRESANHFAFELLKQFFNHTEYNENPFYSPYSIFTALAMAYEGAEGNTADEMADVLNIEQDNTSFHHYVQNLYNKFNGNDEYNISTANALWTQYDFPILSDYVETVEEYYHAESNPIDFSYPQNASETINQWVEEKTNDLIHDLITPDAIKPDLTKLILTNAIYFKGIWKVQFDPVNTTDQPFTLSNGDSVDVQMMNLIDTENVFNYTETDEFQLLELPYAGDSLSMVILLPKATNELSSIINSLDEESYIQCLDSMEEVELDLYLPKFTIETPLYSIKNMLWDLGIHDAFSSDADFSGITGDQSLFIEYVFHKAFVDVNEEGTEAAAATAVVMTLKAVMPGENERIIFNCDHPFIYLIQDNNTNTILFMGILDDPTQ
jgi:serpin B